MRKISRGGGKSGAPGAPLFPPPLEVSSSIKRKTHLSRNYIEMGIKAACFMTAPHLPIMFMLFFIFFLNSIEMSDQIKLHTTHKHFEHIMFECWKCVYGGSHTWGFQWWCQFWHRNSHSIRNEQNVKIKLFSSQITLQQMKLDQNLLTIIWPIYSSVIICGESWNPPNFVFSSIFDVVMAIKKVVI